MLLSVFSEDIDPNVCFSHVWKSWLLCRANDTRSGWIVFNDKYEVRIKRSFFDLET